MERNPIRRRSNRKEKSMLQFIKSLNLYYYLIKFFNQISRSSAAFSAQKALKIRLIQNLYAPYGAIKTFKRLKVFMRF